LYDRPSSQVSGGAPDVPLARIRQPRPARRRRPDDHGYRVPIADPSSGGVVLRPLPDSVRISRETVCHHPRVAPDRYRWLRPVSWRQGRSSARQGVVLCLVLVRYVGDVDPVAPARLCLVEGGVGYLEEVGEGGVAWWGAVGDAD
jgi:hypothetical protein